MVKVGDTIRLIGGFNEGMMIEVTDIRKINGIQWVGGNVIEEDADPDGFIQQRGGQWREGEHFEVVK